MLKDNKDKFVSFYFDVTHLGFHYVCKGENTLCAYGCTVAPPITYNFFYVFWSMFNFIS